MVRARPTLDVKTACTMTCWGVSLASGDTNTIALDVMNSIM